MNTLDVDQETLRKIIHDLRGPLVNLKGFYSELDESIGRMLYVIDESEERHSCNENGDLRGIVNDDVVPILRYLSISIDQLNDRLDLFEKGSMNV